MIKFYYNGIKATDTGTQLQKAWYSNGPLNGFPAGTLTIYAREYTGFSKEVAEAFEIQNDSDHQTDYFDKDRIRVKPDHAKYPEVLAAFIDQQAKREAQTKRTEARRQARRELLAPDQPGPARGNHPAPTMSDPKQTALKAKITRLRNASKKAGLNLAEKLEAQARTKAAQEELRLYRLNIHAEKAYQKALPKRIKQTTKAIDNMAREITRERLREACKKPPAEFQSWGHTRTMAWLKLAQMGNRLVKRLRPKVEEMQGVQRSLSTISTASLEACQQIISPPKVTGVAQRLARK